MTQPASMPKRSSTARPHYINGRILLREPGGVRRSAREVVHHMPSATVLTPPSARFAWSGRVWEQTVLGRQSADGVLLNMAHGGPTGHPRQVNVIQDLIALSHPDSVHPAFAALMRRQLPRLVAEAKVLVAISRHVADQIRTRFGSCADRIEVVPPGISDVFVPGARSEAASQLGLDPNRPVVTALLDPTPRKRSRQVALTLCALQQRRPEVQVVVAGRQRHPRFGRVGGDPDPTPRSTFVDLGDADDAQLARMYQASDVFLSLTTAEGFGLPAVEALRCASAVVSTPVPSLVEHVPDAAVLIEHQRQAIGEVEKLLDSPGRRRDLVATGTEALDGLRWARTAHALGSFMAEVEEL